MVEAAVASTARARPGRLIAARYPGPVARDLLSADSRAVPLRRLTPAEADRLGLAGPLQLSRLEFGRFGWWRRSRWFVVETPARERRLTVTATELIRLGISPGPR